MFLGQTGLLKQKCFRIIGLLGQTLFKHTGLLGQKGLLGYTLLEQTLPSQTLAGSDRDLWKTALTSLEELNAVANDNKAGTEETGLDTVEKDNWGKSKLFNLKDTAILLNTRNCLLQVTPLQFLIELNTDSANFIFPFSTRCTLSKKKWSGLSEPFAKVQQLSLYTMYIKNNL